MKDYASIRDQVKDGDLLLFRGRSLLSRIIRKFTSSPYTHAGIAMWWQPEGLSRRRLLVFEAIGKGIVLSPASRAVDQYDGRVDWYWLTDQARQALDTERLFALALAQLGKRFGALGLVVYALRYILARLRIMDMEGGEDAKNPRAMFCSWYVSYVFKGAGYDVDPKHKNGLTSPADLRDSEGTEYGGTLRYDDETSARRARR